MRLSIILVNWEICCWPLLCSFAWFLVGPVVQVSTLVLPSTENSVSQVPGVGEVTCGEVVMVTPFNFILPKLARLLPVSVTYSNS